jgi:hypothetical protein
MRRLLSETLIDLAESIQPSNHLQPTVRVVSGFLDLPIEVRLKRADTEWDLLTDLPDWRWQSGFAEKPGRLRIAWEQGVAP